MNCVSVGKYIKVLTKDRDSAIFINRCNNSVIKYFDKIFRLEIIEIIT